MATFTPLPLITGSVVTTEQWLTLIRTVRAYLVDNNKDVSKLIDYDFTVRTGTDPGIATLVQRYIDLHNIVQALYKHQLNLLP